MRKLNSRGPYICYSLNNIVSVLIVVVLMLCAALLLFVHFPMKQQIRSEPLQQQQAQREVAHTFTPTPTLCAPPLNALARLRDSTSASASNV